MEWQEVVWVCISLSYVGTMSGFAFVLGLLNHRIEEKTIFKNSIVIIIALYILSFIAIRLMYHWQFLLEALLLVLILLAWVGGRKCQIAALTGGIASGKSTAAKILADQGISIINADEVAHTVMNRMAQRVAAAFPEDEILNADQTINFPKLSETVFRSKTKLKRLNELTHWRVGLALIKEVLYRKFRLKEKYVILDIPLLFETKFFSYVCYPIILVYIDDPELQIRRLLNRQPGLLTREEAESRIAAQMSMDYKKKHSDLLINNEGSLEDLTRDILSKLFPLLVKAID